MGKREGGLGKRDFCREKVQNAGGGEMHHVGELEGQWGGEGRVGGKWHVEGGVRGGGGALRVLVESGGATASRGFQPRGSAAGCWKRSFPRRDSSDCGSWR